MGDFPKKQRNWIKGSTKLVEFNDGFLINLDVKVEDLAAIQNERGYAKIVLSKMKKRDQYGNDFQVYENDFVPDKTKAPKSVGPVSGAKPKAKTTDDLPF